MLQEFSLTPTTIVILLAILALAFLAIRRLVRRGMCDCGDHCDGCSKKKGSSECRACSAADDMVARMERDMSRNQEVQKVG